MFFARRTALLRLTAMAALVASAVLTADALHPDRAFCPLEQACSAARESALGSIFGVPTSILGMLAFGGLFVLTMLPVEWSRPLLRPAGAVAALAGVGFVAYQALVLHTYCPLCLVADGAGFIAGVVTITWPRPPVRLSGRRLAGEPMPRRVAWTVAAALAALAPFVWPRPQAPAWIEITPLAAADLHVEGEASPEAGSSSQAPASSSETSAGASLAEGLPPAPWAVRGTSAPATGQVALATAPLPSRSDGTAAPSRTPPVASAAPAAAPPPPPAVTPILVVEYLNAYCQHCRATHENLDQVLARLEHPVRIRRIYTWGGKGYPIWARACAYAREQGLEDEMFRQLLHSTRETEAEVFAAARRAGVDPSGLGQAFRAVQVPPALERDAELMRSAGLQGLPTLDIGRRRLMGAQSRAELAAALQAALAEIPSAPAVRPARSTDS